MATSTSLTPVERRSVSDAIFEQLRDQILSGVRPPGDVLPPERALCDALGVNRGSVREALRRLEQARLVSVRHGGSSHVLDYRESASLDLLGSLVLRPDGAIDTAVVRSIMEMRSAIAPDAARRAALRGSPAHADALDEAALALAVPDGDLSLLQERAVRFWSVVIESAGNLAYRLAYNALRDTYDRTRELLAPVLAGELRDADAYAAIAAAIRRRDERQAHDLSRALVMRGEVAVEFTLRVIDERLRTSAEEGR